MFRYQTEHYWIGNDEPTYFIADISANHDGDLGRAINLIHLAAESGANAAKFQNFKAPKIVSDYGFRSMGSQLSHQAKWSKSVFQVYQDASLPDEWTEILKLECDKARIDYFSSPYDFDVVDMLDPHVSVYKIGSGDITWTEMLEKIASKKKLVLLATGASDIGEVQRACRDILKLNHRLVLMQCNTNYTGNINNFKHIHLNVLMTYRAMFPEVLLGLSDHTPGHATVLGAVALGARVIEKHFTDDNNRKGPDHSFSLISKDWREMVDRTRELENALGHGQKIVADNEQDTVIIQRRCVRTSTSLTAGTIIDRQHLDVLRPAPKESIPPYQIPQLIGMKLQVDLPAGECLQWRMLAPRAPGSE